MKIKLTLCFTLVLATLSFGLQAQESDPVKPKLVLQITVDQFRGGMPYGFWIV